MNIALILSGGTGTRVGSDIPKQYVKVNQQMVITFCLRTICSHPMIDGIQIVADTMWRDAIKEALKEQDIPSELLVGFSHPGTNRQLSIYHGLLDIRDAVGKDTVVFIHDAARPLLRAEQITACLDAVQNHDGVVPVLPMKDTVYLSTDGKCVSGLLNRSEIFAGQAPEVFRLEQYLAANERLLPERILEINGSTEPAIMAGLDIAMIPGDERNDKITSREDLERFRNMEESRR